MGEDEGLMMTRIFAADTRLEDDAEHFGWEVVHRCTNCEWVVECGWCNRWGQGVLRDMGRLPESGIRPWMTVFVVSGGGASSSYQVSSHFESFILGLYVLILLYEWRNRMTACINLPHIQSKLPVISVSLMLGDATGP